MRNVFDTYHPIINFIFFFAVIGFGVFFTNPIMIGISVFFAFAYGLYLKGVSAAVNTLKFLLPVALFTAIINPMFNHRGATILFYAFTGNPITLESVLYGIAAAGILINVIVWFACYGEIMTSDKFVYLFGRLMPALSLILTMTLCLIPRFRLQLKHISNAQECINTYPNERPGTRRIKRAAETLSAMTSWALENSIETSDSMRARGYGVGRRTSFSLYRFELRDKIMLTLLVLFILFIIIGTSAGAIDFEFYPVLQAPRLSGFSLGVYISYGMLCATPLILEGLEYLKWTYFKSKI